MMNKRIFLSPPFVDRAERAEVESAFDSGYVAPCGPKVDQFELELAKLSGRKYAVAVSSATAALELIFAHLKVDKTWIAIVPTLTFIATVSPACRLGAEPWFVDCDSTGNVDLKLLDKALADAAKTGRKILFIAVDLFGRCCNYDTIEKLCRKYKAKFVCDSAEAVGAMFKGRPAGSTGLAAVYSFNGNKLITTSGGGAILTDDKKLADHVKKLSQQSREKALWYEHKEIAYNFRMSNLLAAVGLAQLSKMDKILKAKKNVREFYGRCAEGKHLELLPKVEGENNWLTIMLLRNSRERDSLIKLFEAENVETRPVWKPMHLQKVFKGCRVYGGNVSENLFSRGVCLASGAGLTEADFKRIAKVLDDFAAERK